jgi:spore photoproduct lyase
MKRHKPEGLDYADHVKSYRDILTEIDHHAWFDTTEKPNQTHAKYITYDISCNEDFALHLKYHDWYRIFNFFLQHPKAMGSFATKYVNRELLNFDPNGKIRIRFSLMPENIRKILEPNTSSIMDRLKAINDFKRAGYDVHLNFSPVIVYDGWIEDYQDLFAWVNGAVDKKYRDEVKAEVIFLTHNADKHEYNLANNLPGEDLLWRPDIQESKRSEFGGENIRYEWQIKQNFIYLFREAHKQVIPWNTIRYIF